MAIEQEDKKPYQPTEEEMKMADDTMTDRQKKSSEDRERRSKEHEIITLKQAIEKKAHSVGNQMYGVAYTSEENKKFLESINDKFDEIDELMNSLKRGDY